MSDEEVEERLQQRKAEERGALHFEVVRTVFDRFRAKFRSGADIPAMVHDLAVYLFDHVLLDHPSYGSALRRYSGKAGCERFAAHVQEYLATGQIPVLSLSVVFAACGSCIVLILEVMTHGDKPDELRAMAGRTAGHGGPQASDLEDELYGAMNLRLRA